MFGGREQMFSLGALPAVSLSDARAKRDDVHTRAVHDLCFGSSFGNRCSAM
jgi:hypothetical protein